MEGLPGVLSACTAKLLQASICRVASTVPVACGWLLCMQGRHDAEVALLEARGEAAAQAESIRQLRQQLAAAEGSGAAEPLASSPAG